MFIVVVTLALALAAGFALSSWWAALALAVAVVAGAFASGSVYVLLSPAGADEGVTGPGAVLVIMFFFAVLALPSLIILLFGGVGLGRLQGLTLRQPHALSAGEASASRWIAALSLVIATGYSTRQLANMPGLLGMQPIPGDVFSVVPGIVYAVVLAASCLIAGWLLRSWWGLVVAPVVYAGVAVIAVQLFGGVGAWSDWIVAFALYIVLPAVVMSAIGTAIGMRGAGHGGQQPQQPRTALPAT